MTTIRRATIKALLAQNSVPLFGQLAAEDLAAIYEKRISGNLNHKRTWCASMRVLREALETKCDEWFPGWRHVDGQPYTETWLKATRTVNQYLKDIKDMAELSYNAEETL